MFEDGVKTWYDDKKVVGSTIDCEGDFSHVSLLLFLLYTCCCSSCLNRVISIRGHRPNYSLEGNIFANREGDYESCFREGEENYKPGYVKKIFACQFFVQNQGGKKKS